MGSHSTLMDEKREYKGPDSLYFFFYLGIVDIQHYVNYRYAI